VSRIVELRDADAYADLFGHLKGDLRTYNPHHYESRATSFDESLVCLCILHTFFQRSDRCSGEFGTVP
jgi:hypothetical protein